jgi:Ser/Thr protein kinase RdoA (MazF antagonist)
VIDDVLGAWILPPGTAPMQVDSGLINQTIGIGHNGRLLGILQRLNTDIFGADVHYDIEAVTSWLETKQVPTPRLVPTLDGPLWHEDGKGGVWRLQTPIGTRTHHTLTTASLAREAGALVGRFHTATQDLDHTFKFTRPGAHDTTAHYGALRLSLMTGRGHRLFRQVSPLADQLLDAWDCWEGPTDLPERIIHGDLKVSNLRFDDDDRAVALIDLDTLARGTLDVELGDAMRSWCNPAGENLANVTFDVERFRAAMDGYLSTCSLDAVEREAIVPGIQRICLELSARFLRDALEESYFGWDEQFGTRGDHNLLRARSQAALATSVNAQRGTLEAIVRGS